MLAELAMRGGQLMAIVPMAPQCVPRHALPPPVITVHHLEHSRSQRVLWLLEELGLPYEIQHYQRDPKTSLAPPELRLVHPLGKSPVISDGEHTVAESGAIIEYLVERHGHGKLALGFFLADHMLVEVLDDLAWVHGGYLRLPG